MAETLVNFHLLLGTHIPGQVFLTLEKSGAELDGIWRVPNKRIGMSIMAVFGAGYPPPTQVLKINNRVYTKLSNAN